MNKISINFKINGKDVSVMTDPSKTLLDLIREDLMLTGTKRGCEIGECGSCTIIFNGKTVNSCMILATQAEGSSIITIEGLAKPGKLHPIQQAFIEKGAVQCGYCTPGMILSAKVLLDENPSPTKEDIRTTIAGNICRCTGYRQIVEAIEYSSELLKQQK